MFLPWSSILPYWQGNKLTCYCLMDAGKRYKILWSDKRDPHPVIIIQALSSAITGFVQWELECSSHGSRDAILLTEDNRGIATDKCLTYQSQRLMLGSRYGAISQEGQPATFWQVHYIESLPPWKRQSFILNRTDTYSRYGFAFPAHRTSVSTTSHGQRERQIGQ